MKKNLVLKPFVLPTVYISILLLLMLYTAKTLYKEPVKEENKDDKQVEVKDIVPVIEEIAIKRNERSDWVRGVSAPEVSAPLSAPEVSAPLSAPEGATIVFSFDCNAIEAPSGAVGGAGISVAVGGATIRAMLVLMMSQLLMMPMTPAIAMAPMPMDLP